MMLLLLARKKLESYDQLEKLFNNLKGVLIFMSFNINRRQFLFRSGLAGVGVLGIASGVGVSESTALAQSVIQNPGELSESILGDRAQNAFQIRQQAAQMGLNRPKVNHQNNNDEKFYTNRAGNFHKTLPHNDLGEVDPGAYDALRRALTTGRAQDFERIPQGGIQKLANPQAAFAYDLMGPDNFTISLPHAPFMLSQEAGGEVVEVYWKALARDVPFSDYESDPTVERAAGELSSLSDFRGPKQGGSVTPLTIFRGNTAGDLAGPYISQFLFHPVPHGAQQIEQRSQTTVAGLNHMVDYANWLDVQNGNLPESNIYEETPRYISNGRGLGEYVHQDYPGQAFVNAALIMLNKGTAFDHSNPYLQSATQDGFVTFNITHILNVVSGVVSCALKHAWFHKWLVNRRVRPEAFGGLVHNQLIGKMSSVVSNDVLESEAVQEAFRQNNSYLLPMAYSEGSPTHPAYPAGHATISGACVTALKAMFDEDAVFEAPVVADRDGASLLPYSGSALTVGGELDKLAANISLGRDFAGVHYRSDGIQGMFLGESVALGVLAELRLTYPENFAGFSLTTFSGEKVSI